MMILRRLLSMTLCLSLSIPVTGNAAVLKSRTPESMLQLVDEYIFETTSQQPGPAHMGAGRAVWIAKNIVSQVVTFSPEDFNMFLFYTIERYIKEPKQRPQIYLLLKQIHDAIKVDLDNTKQIEAGPYHEMVKGSYTYLTWIIVLYVGFRFKAAQTMRGKEFLLQVEKRELAIGKNKYFRSAYNVVSNPVVWGSLAGTGIGYLNYLGQVNKVRRSNPLEILKVVQANLACEASYRGLEIEQEWLKIKDEPLAIGHFGPQLTEKIKALLGEAGLLQKQFQRLESLDVKERLFQQSMKEFPKAESWQQFRKNLTEAEESKDGQCRQMSLVHLRLELDKISAAIKRDTPEKTDEQVKDDSDYQRFLGGENIAPPKQKPGLKPPTAPPVKKDDSDFQRFLGGENIEAPTREESWTPPAPPKIEPSIDDEDSDELMEQPGKKDE